MLLGHRYMYSYKFDSTLNVNHLLISFFIKHHCPVAFKILSLWFVLGLFVQYQRVDIYFDKKFQIKFSRGFAKRPKLTFDLVGFDLTKGFQASIFSPKVVVCVNNKCRLTGCWSTGLSRRFLFFSTTR